MRNRGFTLIEILVVITIIAAILAIATPMLFKGRDQADLVLCKNNLKEIGGLFLLYQQRFDEKMPKTDSGIQFLCELVKEGFIHPIEKEVKVLQCPGDKGLKQQGFKAEDYKDVKAINSTMVSYSGRNTKDYPLKFSKRAEEPIACDDDEDEPNHPNKVNVLYLDFQVGDVDINEFGGAEAFRVGHDSPFEKFKVLNNN